MIQFLPNKTQNSYILEDGRGGKGQNLIFLRCQQLQFPMFLHPYQEKLKLNSQKLPTMSLLFSTLSKSRGEDWSRSVRGAGAEEQV